MKQGNLWPSISIIGSVPENNASLQSLEQNHNDNFHQNDLLYNASVFQETFLKAIFIVWKDSCWFWISSKTPSKSIRKPTFWFHHFEAHLAITAPILLTGNDQTSTDTRLKVVQLISLCICLNLATILPILNIPHDTLCNCKKGIQIGLKKPMYKLRNADVARESTQSFNF